MKFLFLFCSRAISWKLSEFCANPNSHSSPVSLSELDIPFSNCSLSDFTGYELVATYDSVSAYFGLFRSLRLDRNLVFRITDVLSGDILRNIDILNARLELHLKPGVGYIESSLKLDKNLGSKLVVHGGSFHLAGHTKLTIYHTNDIHCHITEDAKGTYVGMSRLVTFLKEERKKGNVLAFDVGDFISGQPICNLHKGLTASDFVNFADYDAVTIGNHLFDFGKENTLKVLKSYKMPVVCSNIEDPNYPDYKPYIIKYINNLKIGIYGLLTTSMETLTKASNVEGITFRKDLINISQSVVKELRSQGCDFIICLTHIGTGGTQNFANQYDGVDLIIDGHSHTKLPNGIYTLNNDYQTLIVQTGCYLKAVGKVELTIDSVTKQIINKEASLLLPKDFVNIKQDPETQKRLNEVIEETNPITQKVVGHTNVDLTRGTGGKVNDLLSTAFLYGGNLTNKRADCCILNSGGVRDEIPDGDVTYGQVLTVIPFMNLLNILNVQGQMIIDAMAKFAGLSTDRMAGLSKIPIVSGLKFDVDPAASGKEKIKNVRFVDIDGNKIKDLVPTENYTLATLDFLAQGGDGLTMLKSCPILHEFGFDIDSVIEFFDALPQKTIKGDEGFFYPRANDINDEEPVVMKAMPRVGSVDPITVEIVDGYFNAIGATLDDTFNYTVKANSFVASNLDYLKSVSTNDVMDYVTTNGILLATHGEIKLAHNLDGKPKKLLTTTLTPALYAMITISIILLTAVVVLISVLEKNRKETKKAKEEPTPGSERIQEDLIPRYSEP